MIGIDMTKPNYCGKSHPINRSTIIAFNGKSARIEDHAAEQGLALTVALERLRNGWPIERALLGGRAKRLPAQAPRARARGPRGMSLQRQSEILHRAIANSLARERAKGGSE
jgi:hypothetical protein